MESINTFEDALNYLVYKSRENNNPVADAYVAYLLNLQYDKEEKRFYFSDKNITPEKAKEVIEKVNALINAKNDGVVETLKLQITYELSHIQEEDKIEKEYDELIFELERNKNNDISSIKNEMDNLRKQISEIDSKIERDKDSIEK